MKGDFTVNSNLLAIRETLQDKKPYAVMILSTTGLDNKTFAEHSPTRVTLKQFEYDDNIKGYKESIAFDKLVKAPESAVNAALQNSEYDAFANSGIDKDSYIRGENVLPVDQFKEEFNRVLSAIEGDNTTLIINGTTRFAHTYLDKIGCYDTIERMHNDGRVLEQVALTKEYFSLAYADDPTLAPRNGLDDLRYTLASSSPVLTRAASTLGADDFREKFPTADYTKYKAEHENLINKHEAIVGSDNRINVINAFLSKYGRDEKVLPEKFISDQLEANASYVQTLSENGKENYHQASLDEKFRILVDKKVIDPDKIMDGKSEFNKLIEAIENKENKGLIFMHAASTGFDFSKPLPQRVGFPIQFTAMAYTRPNDGVLSFEQKPKGLSINIKAPEKDILLAEKNITASKPYDTFKETGINLEDYKNNIGVKSENEAREIINRYFTKFAPKDYAIVVLGGTNGSDLSFTQNCLSNLGNFPVNNASTIDMTQAIKDYAYLSTHSQEYNYENALFDTDKVEKFGLQDVANAREGENKLILNSTTLKCAFAANLASELERQQVELFRPAELEKLAEADRRAQMQAENTRPAEKAEPKAEPPTNVLEALIVSNAGSAPKENAPKEASPEFDKIYRRAPSEPERISRVRESDTENRTSSPADKASAWRAASANGPMGGATLLNNAAMRERNIGEQPRNFQNTAPAQTERSFSGAMERASRAMPDSARNMHRDATINTGSQDRLMPIILEQSEVIARQSQVIAEMNDKLIEMTSNFIAVSQKQTEKMMDMMVSVLSAQNPEQINAKDMSASFKQDGAHLNQLIDEVDVIRNNTNVQKAKTFLSDANQALIKAQNEMERDTLATNRGF